MKLALALDDKKMDLRLVDRFLAEGKITKTEYDQYLASLADEEGNYEVLGERKSESVEG